MHVSVTASATPVICQTQPSAQSSSFDVSGLLRQYQNPEGFLLLGGLSLAILLSVLFGSRRGKFTTGRLCGVAEKLSATHTALRQIRDRRHDRVCLWCGTPRYWWSGPPFQGWVARLQTVLGSSPTVWLPDAQASILTIGRPNAGKTFSVIDRALESAMVQGFPILLYAKKEDHMQLHVPLAARYNYEVDVFAPGEHYSGVINPLDFMQSPQDGTMAGELAQVIHRNTRTVKGSGDEFFAEAGILLAKAILQLVKGSPFPDMGMVYTVLRLPQLVHRLDHAVQTRAIDEWVASSFIQFLSAKDAEKTISSIMATATGTFSSFIQPDVLRAFLGDSNIPTHLTGRRMIVFKLDDARRSVVGPLVAAAMHMVIVGNLSQPRVDPVLISLDEFPSLRFDRMPNWVNEYRSNGGCFSLGVQSLEQIYETYGQELGNAIISACGTHILFNPGRNPVTAKRYSESYGEKEVMLKNKSVSQSIGHRSTSWNQSLQRMPVISPDEIMRFPEGKCVITNPAYASGGEISIPYCLKIPVPLTDRNRAKECKKLFSTHTRPALCSRVTLPDLDSLTLALSERIAAAEQLLPLPPQMDKGQPPPPASSGSSVNLTSRLIPAAEQVHNLELRTEPPF